MLDPEANATTDPQIRALLRQGEVLELRRKGQSLAEIAETLHTPLEVIEADLETFQKAYAAKYPGGLEEIQERIKHLDEDAKDIRAMIDASHGDNLELHEMLDAIMQARNTLSVFRFMDDEGNGEGQS